MKLLSVVLLTTLVTTPALCKPAHRPPAPNTATAEYWNQLAQDYKWRVLMPTIAASGAWLPPDFVREQWNRALWDIK